MNRRKKGPARSSGSETSAALRNVIGFRVRRLQTLFQAHWQNSIDGDAIAITQVQGGVLLLIEDNPKISQIALSNLLKIEPPTLLQSLRPLVAKGLVARERSTEDSRAFQLSLTPLGRRAADWVRRWTPQQEADFLHNLTDKERERLLALLEKAILSGEQAIERSTSLEADS